MKVYRRKKGIYYYLFLIVPLLFVLLLSSLYYFSGSNIKFAFFHALFITFILCYASFEDFKGARIEIHPEKIKYTNLKRHEVPPAGEFLLSDVVKIYHRDTKTIEIQTNSGEVHNLKVNLLTANDRNLLETELAKILPFERLTCLSCGSPMGEIEQKCLKCDWTFNSDSGDT